MTQTFQKEIEEVLVAYGRDGKHTTAEASRIIQLLVIEAFNKALDKTRQEFLLRLRG